jgi:hypothetical protein
MAHHSTRHNPRARRVTFSLVAFVALGIATPCAWSAIVIEGTDASDVIDVSSSSMAHEIRGRGDDDRLTGSSAADAIDGGYGYDRMQGGDGADLLIGGPGNDIIDGGAGTDDARYARVRASHAVSGTVGALQVRALVGTDGTDTLTRRRIRRPSQTDVIPSPTCFQLRRTALRSRPTTPRVHNAACRSTSKCSPTTRTRTATTCLSFPSVLRCMARRRCTPTGR